MNEKTNTRCIFKSGQPSESIISSYIIDRLFSTVNTFNRPFQYIWDLQLRTFKYIRRQYSCSVHASVCAFDYYLLEATYCVFHRKEALPLYIQMTTVAFVVVLSIMTEVCIIVSFVYDSSVLTNAVNLLVLVGVESVCILIFELGVHHLKKEITTIQTQLQQFAVNTTPEFNETSANPKNPSSTSCFDYWRTSLQCSCDYKN